MPRSHRQARSIGLSAPLPGLDPLRAATEDIAAPDNIDQQDIETCIAHLLTSRGIAPLPDEIDPLAEGGDPARKARDLQDEIRRREAERDRSRDERNYLGRLLENF